MDLTTLTIGEAAGLLERRQVSPLELTRAFLERIERLDPLLNSFISVTPETALQRAAEMEEEWQRGERRSPLHAIPLALKDLYETQGLRTTAGSKFFSDYVPSRDAAVVEKLKTAGAVLLGKLNMHEIALGVTNENRFTGDCKNPWALERVSGGSSGGSAAALAAGLCLGSMGSDTGGSIRIPASLCGVTGLKPTYGQISLRGVIPLSWSLDHAGPMGKCVSDVAILLTAVSGYDAHDPASADVPVENYLAQSEGGVRGWRVALAADEFFSVADEPVLRAVRAAADVFTELEAHVEEVEIPNALEAARANGLLVTSDAAAFHRERLQSHPEGFGADVRQRLEMGAAYSSTEYALARRLQAEFRRQMERFFEDYDVLLTPTTPICAPLRGSQSAVERAGQLTRFTAPFNLSGLPALSLPGGFIQDGDAELPIGLQIVARPWGEAKCLRAGLAYEQATGWHSRKPQL